MENQEVIHLDVTKNDSDLSEENQIPENPKQKNDDWVQKDIIRDNVDTEFSIFDNLIDTDKDSDHPFKIEEESLFGKIYKKEIRKNFYSFIFIKR